MPWQKQKTSGEMRKLHFVYFDTAMDTSLNVFPESERDAVSRVCVRRKSYYVWSLLCSSLGYSNKESSIERVDLWKISLRVHMVEMLMEATVLVMVFVRHLIHWIFN
jgi:hypothetical protein